MADDLRARVKSEREGRNWSIREAATAGDQIISNTTWGTFEAGGPVTRKVRSAITRAFDWPTDWPENPPLVTPPASAGTLDAADLLAELLDNQRRTGAALTQLSVQLARIATHLGLPDSPPEPASDGSPRPAQQGAT